MKTLRTILLLSILALGFKPAKADPPSLTVALNTVTKAYFGVKNALISGNASAVQSKAMDLINALNSVPDGSMTAEQHRLWFDNLNKLEYDSRHINESTAIDHQREHFASLSDNLFSVLKTFKLNTYTLYKDYCPMKKVNWISESASIKNPYYGTGSMVTCGNIKEELKPSAR
jgi:hypothetical protein